MEAGAQMTVCSLAMHSHCGEAGSMTLVGLRMHGRRKQAFDLAVYLLRQIQ